MGVGWSGTLLGLSIGLPDVFDVVHLNLRAIGMVTFFAWIVVMVVLLSRAIASQDEAGSPTLALHG